MNLTLYKYTYRQTYTHRHIDRYRLADIHGHTPNIQYICIQTYMDIHQYIHIADTYRQIQKYKDKKTYTDLQTYRLIILYRPVQIYIYNICIQTDIDILDKKT